MKACTVISKGLTNQGIEILHGSDLTPLEWIQIAHGDGGELLQVGMMQFDHRRRVVLVVGGQEFVDLVQEHRQAHQSQRRPDQLRSHALPGFYVRRSLKKAHTHTQLQSITLIPEIRTYRTENFSPAETAHCIFCTV